VTIPPKSSFFFLLPPPHQTFVLFRSCIFIFTHTLPSNFIQRNNEEKKLTFVNLVMKKKVKQVKQHNQIFHQVKNHEKSRKLKHRT